MILLPAWRTATQSYSEVRKRRISGVYLDIDKTEGLGPETITFHSPVPGRSPHRRESGCFVFVFGQGPK